MDNWKNIIAALVLALGIVGMAFVLKQGMDNRTYNGRTIAVRGVATQRVTADYATGVIGLNSTQSATPQEAKAVVKAWMDSISKYAAQTGLPKEAITRDPISVDELYNYDNGRVVSSYYIARSYVHFYADSTQVLNLDKFNKGSECLIDMGVVLSYTSFEYSFSDDALTRIKPEMITTATKNARTAAEQLAADNNCKVGDIVSASQGYFEINRIEGRPQYEKEIRVVNNAEFYLK